MGLDMFAYAVSPEQVVNLEAQTDLEIKEDAKPNKFAYWRKFNHLHGWMHKLYEAKGGKDEEFNCSTVRLTKTSLDQLDRAWKKGKLKATAGFLFGSPKWFDEYDTSLKKFLSDARALIDEGKIVYYYSWF